MLWTIEISGAFCLVLDAFRKHILCCKGRPLDYKIMNVFDKIIFTQSQVFFLGNAHQTWKNVPMIKCIYTKILASKPDVSNLLFWWVWGIFFYWIISHRHPTSRRKDSTSFVMEDMVSWYEIKPMVCYRDGYVNVMIFLIVHVMR